MGRKRLKKTTQLQIQASSDGKESWLGTTKSPADTLVVMVGLD